IDTFEDPLDWLSKNDYINLKSLDYFIGIQGSKGNIKSAWIYPGSIELLNQLPHVLTINSGMESLIIDMSDWTDDSYSLNALKCLSNSQSLVDLHLTITFYNREYHKNLFEEFILHMIENCMNLRYFTLYISHKNCQDQIESK